MIKKRLHSVDPFSSTYIKKITSGTTILPDRLPFIQSVSLIKLLRSSWLRSTSSNALVSISWLKKMKCLTNHIERKL